MAAFNDNKVPPYPEGTVGYENKTQTFWPNLSATAANALTEVEKWFYESSGFQLDDIVLEYVDPKLVFLRYLRANNFDVKKTIAHITKNVAWRKDNKVKEVVQMRPEQILGCEMKPLTKVFPHWHHGYDNTGRPVIYKMYGKFDATHIKTMTGGSFDNVVRYHIWEQEACLRLCLNQTIKTGKLVETITGVVDVKGMGLYQITRDFLALTKLIADVDQGQYPETLGRIYIVNTPSAFPMVWRMVKPWLDPIVASKIFIFGGQKDFEPALFDFIGKENLPANYGGDLPELSAETHPYRETMKEYFDSSAKLAAGSGDDSCATSVTEETNVGDEVLDPELLQYASGF